MAQKAGLNRKILAASWGTLIRMVAYKAEPARRELIIVTPGQRAIVALPGSAPRPPTGPPRLASPAGLHRSCALELHTDLNAARNILSLGSTLRRESAKRRRARYEPRVVSSWAFTSLP